MGETGKKNTTEESRLLHKQHMSNYEDAYHIIWHNKGFTDAYFLHHHDYYEISFYLGKNPGVFLIDGKEYVIQQGDVVLTSLFQSHMMNFRRNENHERFNLGLDPRILLSFSTENANLLQIFEKGKHFPVLHTDIWAFQKYMNIIQKLTSLNIQHGKELAERALIYQILAHLYEDCYSEEYKSSSNSKRIEILSRIIRYIETHLVEPITLDELAELGGYSVPHICRLFKEETNDTLNHYILEKRLQKAKHLLMREIPIREIARLTGFNSYSYFFRAFKKANHIGPEKWRGLNGSNKG